MTLLKKLDKSGSADIRCVQSGSSHPCSAWMHK